MLNRSLGFFWSLGLFTITAVRGEPSIILGNSLSLLSTLRNHFFMGPANGQCGPPLLLLRILAVVTCLGERAAVLSLARRH